MVQFITLTWLPGLTEFLRPIMHTCKGVSPSLSVTVIDAAETEISISYCTLFILMDFLILIDNISMDLSILYFKGLPV